MFELITIILISIISVLVVVNYMIPRLRKKKQDKFEENYLGLLVKKNKELISSLKSLIEESLELVRKVEDEKNFQEAFTQSKKVYDSLDEAFNEIMKGTREESIVNLTILENQLNGMTEKVYKDMVLIEEKLGIERIIH